METSLVQTVTEISSWFHLFSNIIINAIKYTSIGGKVEVVLDRNDNHAVVQIRDTGIGIAPQEQQRIFDRFYRVDSDRSRDTGGSGLGLAIAEAIVKAHKGSLQVQSELGKGSVFTVQFALEIIRWKGCKSINHLFKVILKQLSMSKNSIPKLNYSLTALGTSFLAMGVGVISTLSYTKVAIAQAKKQATDGTAFTPYCCAFPSPSCRWWTST